MCDTYFSLNKVPKIPERAVYIPDFITEGEENDIIDHVYAAPKPRWTQLSHRKLQNYGGIPHPKGMIVEEIPKWLQKYVDKVASSKAFPDDKLPNHVLVNEYLPGQGILPHLDGPLFYPTICTISCGSHAVLRFHPKSNYDAENSCPTSVTASLLLERRSLIIVQEKLYNDYTHSIDERVDDLINNDIANVSSCNQGNNVTLQRQTRISLTIRHVPHAAKFKLKLSR